MVGKKIAELCLQKNIDKVCFDRGGNIYHGRVQVRQLPCRHKLLHESTCFNMYHESSKYMHHQHCNMFAGFLDNLSNLM